MFKVYDSQFKEYIRISELMKVKKKTFFKPNQTGYLLIL